jgi:hypothetical protein
MTENLFEASRFRIPVAGCLCRGATASVSKACPGGVVGPVGCWTTILGFVVGVFLSAPAHSQVPCDFKGVSVGDKLTREQLMQRLGIPQFKKKSTRFFLGRYAAAY